MKPLRTTADHHADCFLLALAMPVLLVAIGTIGYTLIEGWPLFDSLYMTVITLTTVGFREVHELSSAGQVFTMFLALGGVFTLFYAATSVIGFVVGGEVLDLFGSRRMQRNLAELKDHLIVCGFGRMGRLVCHEFSSQGLPFVVVDKQADLFERFELPHGIAMHGDAASDEILQRVGIDRARAIRREHGLIVVAIKQASGKMLFNPPADTRLATGDILIMLGRRTDLDHVAPLAAG